MVAIADRRRARKSLKAATASSRPVGDRQGTTHDVAAMNGPTYFVRGEHLRYVAFGRYVGSISAPGLGPQLVRYMFTSQELDGAIGLYYYNHRWYDALTATFTTHDPIGWRGGQWNLTMYVGNDPVNNTDPLGLLEEKHFLVGSHSEWLDNDRANRLHAEGKVIVVATETINDLVTVVSQQLDTCGLLPDLVPGVMRVGVG